MARPLRISPPGSCHHVISRGNARGLVFVDDQDRRTFVELLARAVDRFGLVIYAYCLMSNHYHLVVETPRGNLSAAMRHLNGCYAQYFNRRQARCGHVFQARFRSILVETDSYLLVLCRYVVANPVRAGLCERLDEWPWSSYRATVGINAGEAFLAADRLLARFASARARARARYRSFVSEGLMEPLEPEVVGERLGTGRFLRDRFGCDVLPEIPRVQVEPLPPTLQELFAGVDTTPIATAYRLHGYTMREIAEYLGCHYSTVSRKLRAQEAVADP